MSQGPYDPNRGPDEEGHGYGQPPPPQPPQGYGYGQTGQTGQQPAEYGYGQTGQPPADYGYGQTGQPPADYGYGQSAPPPPPGYGAYDIDTGATLALILSIVALVICQPASIVTLILSNNATRKVQETGKYQDATMAKAAKVISIIGIVLFALAVLTIALLIIIGLAAGGTYSYRNS